jgi:two-component system KDP operon response regulator KdpE
MFAARIVIIEDDSAIRSAVRAAVEAEGGVAFEAASGSAGLALCLSERPDLVVLDLGLPDMTGRQVCRAVRETGAMPILVLSARQTVDDKAELLDSGADDYLTKPFSTVELRARMRAQLRRARMGRIDPHDGRLVHGELSVDLRARRVLRHDVAVHLTPTEWELLRALALDAGRTVTHDQLFARVWGRRYGDAQQYLRVYIAHLRRKIEVDPLRPVIIVTEAGVGYRFALPAAPNGQ